MRALILVAAVLTSSCSAAAWGAFAEGYAAGAAGAATPATAGTKLMLFGGPSHQTYLGCVNCNQYATDSIFNFYGKHGSAYGLESVVNQYSQFASPYSRYSACSPYAADPPVIVDGDGRFYGRLTVNTVHRQRTTSQRLLAWLAAVCAAK